MRYGYYPGCSLECSAAAYDVSVRAVADVLGIEFAELDDWNCCGATELFSQDELTACAVIARNLALAAPQFDQLVAPCAACFCNLAKTDKLMCENAAMNAKINEALAAGGLHYQAGRVRVRHLLEVIYHDVGEMRLREKVVRPLDGLRVAAYYGCQVVRPLKGSDCTEYPMQMDEMFTWIGAEAVDFPLKSRCCGGHMTQISEPQAFEMIRRLIECAVEHDADVILCLCPMCQLNLDAYQRRVNSFFKTDFNMPIIYFTQMLGVALGIEMSKLGFGSEIIAARPVIDRKLATAILAGAT